MTGLSIADLQDGRRALVRIGEDRCEVVTVLTPEDLKPRPWYEDQVSEKCEGLVLLLGDQIIGIVQSTRPLQIPPPPPKKRITAEDLLKRAQENGKTERRPLTPEEQSLRNINRLRGEDPDAPLKV